MTQEKATIEAKKIMNEMMLGKKVSLVIDLFKYNEINYKTILSYHIKRGFFIDEPMSVTKGKGGYKRRIKVLHKKEILAFLIHHIMEGKIQ